MPCWFFRLTNGPDVEAADAGVAVVAGLGVVVTDYLLEAANVLAEAVRVDGGVLDVGQGLGVAVDAHQEAEASATDGPDVGLLAGVGHVD